MGIKEKKWYKLRCSVCGKNDYISQTIQPYLCAECISKITKKK